MTAEFFRSDVDVLQDFFPDSRNNRPIYLIYYFLLHLIYLH